MNYVSGVRDKTAPNFNIPSINHRFSGKFKWRVEENIVRMRSKRPTEVGSFDCTIVVHTAGCPSLFSTISPF